MPRNPAKHSARPSRPRNRCQHVTTAGRRCRMLRAPGHPGLCFFHAEQNQEFINADEVAAELFTGIGESGTPVDINRALGKLFKLVAAQRIPLRTARALAYISQQILNIVGPMAAGNFGATNENDGNLNQLRETMARRTAPQASEVAKTEVG
jgi:hypothetical protein